MKARKLLDVEDTGNIRPRIDRYYDQFYGADEGVWAVAQDPIDLERRRKHHEYVGRASTEDEMQSWRDQMAREKEAILKKGC